MINNKRIKIIITICSILAIFALLACFVFVFLRKDESLRIDNFDDYYYNVPEKTKSTVFSTLYGTVLKNSSTHAPHNGAIIRDSEPYLYTYNNNYTGYYGEFIVDIPEIQQSYLVKFTFNEDPDSFMGGFASLIYCLPKDKMVYPDFGCKENLPFVTEDN